MDTSVSLTEQMLDVGGHRLRLHCEGEGSPAVILETGMPGFPLEGLHHLHAGIAAFTTACSYDRAGIGLSEPGPLPRTGLRIVSELHTLLQRAGIDPPYILVGVSFGGHYIRLFTTKYPGEVAGLLFVDCSHEEMVARFPPAMGRVFPLTRYVLGAFKLMARLGIPRLLGARTPLLSQLLSEVALPEEQRQRLVAHFARREQWEGMYEEVRGYQKTEDEVRAARRELPSFDDLPITVLTALATWNEPGRRPPGVTPEAVVPVWMELQRDLASLSSRSAHHVFEDFTHTSLLGPQGARHVVDALRLMVESARATRQGRLLRG